MANGNRPRIGYENLFEDAATVVASNEVVGFEKENAYDWLSYDWWKPGVIGSQTITLTFAAAKTPDYFACFGHNLGSTGASVVLQRGSGSPLVWADVFTDVAPTDTEVVFETFTTTASTDWRLLLTDCTVDTLVGVVSFGTLLELEEGMRSGFTPPTLDRDPEILNSVSVGGAFLGRSLRRMGNLVSIVTDGVTPTWVRSSWEPFLDHAELKPFFFSWDDENHPAEAAYCWTSKGIDRPSYSSTDFMRIALTCNARVK